MTFFLSTVPANQNSKVNSSPLSVAFMLTELPILLNVFHQWPNQIST